MKKVVESRQVAHLWANKSQDEARNAGGNFYFTGPAIYSYGSHFIIAAHLPNGEILLNDDRRSVTTSKQQCFVRQALHGSHRIVYVPELDDNLWRNLSRCMSEPDGKRMPDVVLKMATKVQDIVQAMIGRRNSDKLSGEWVDAVSLQEDALKLLAMCAKGKRAPKWPLALLPAYMPSDKVERDAWILAFSRGRLIEEYKALLAICAEQFAPLQREYDNTETNLRMRPQLQNVHGRLSHLRGNLDKANKQYKNIYGRNSAQVTTMVRKLAFIVPRLDSLAKQFKGAWGAYEMQSYVRQAYAELRKLKTPMPYRSNMAGHIASKMQDACHAMQDADLDYSYATHALRRINMAARWGHDAESIKAAEQAIRDAQDYNPKFESDALRVLNTAKRHAGNAIQTGNEFFASRQAALFARIEKEAAPIREAIKAKNESAVADWIKGERQSLPQDAGTYARIQGDEMVTSRGARVPLVHACRLARIARRVIAHGGKVWENGTGPMVGGFRVDAIRSDGSASIGCHEFDGQEGMRLLALLDACECCAQVSETAEA